MNIVSIHQRQPLEEYLLHDPEVNALSIGDLDDFFWPYTTWYASMKDGLIDRLALLYSGAGMPVLLCMDPTEEEATQAFIRGLFRLLPAEVYTHFRPGLEPVLQEAYHVEVHGLHFKMALRDATCLEGWNLAEVVSLSTQDHAALEDLYQAAYPGNFFDVRMLETGLYYGIWDGLHLVSAAGIHVYSHPYQVACVGNVTTLPAYRGGGLAKKVCARLVQELQKRVRYITLNVKADNLPAIRAYRQLGFAVIAEYGEYILRCRYRMHDPGNAQKD
ncbi:MAG: GNAT family N-acetyltransferase [Anaerolineae bacterium]|nr:GNAT family N-acetyltransferase [Anaerolineae bacterium]